MVYIARADAVARPVRLGVTALTVRTAPASIIEVTTMLKVCNIQPLGTPVGHCWQEHRAPTGSEHLR
eukprot:4571597-Alexandrium_andersonii.AAC.1